MAKKSPSPAAAAFDSLVHSYGDLLFDLCQSVLPSPSQARSAFRAILLELRGSRETREFKEYGRAWVLRTACLRLRAHTTQFQRKLSSAERIELDAASNLSLRLKLFDSYFQRLNTEDQLLLLFRDKYGLPYPEIAAAMETPESSLKMRRQQALRCLEEWIWEQK